MEIRHIRETELEQFFRLLKAKAEFDGCPEGLTATKETLHDALFSRVPLTHALVAVKNDILVGMATYHSTFSTFLSLPCLWLDDLYVFEEWRGKGVGKALMKALSEIARSTNCGRIDWLVARSNTNGKDFYQRIGGKISELTQAVRLDQKAIMSLSQ